MRKKTLLKILTLCLFFISLFRISEAQAFTLGVPTLESLYNKIVAISNWIFAFLALGSVIGVVIGGIMFVASSGEPSKKTTATKMIIYSLIGVFIGSFAWALITWIGGIAEIRNI
ncbi:MAG: hypothetical protein PHH17_02930 [Candidatus Pacebacteria bacterium]|jgi:hypothetical protein|nr:hypothetical protein [Candidatus Paceibacterota bacterium]MDD3072540.1 hypothetical protein [Candidatus Paceibacterota bacterium]MDD3729270.1 hypothetical protein [Candidatus Paceibacterota bacterium]MDD4201499.1 hypothetical protein [Candidatus Paceibacterota bacterium]MDD4467390.1 hypothetical protein [Candidatus Paceibacterota bacterium]